MLVSNDCLLEQRNGLSPQIRTVEMFFAEPRLIRDSCDLRPAAKRATIQLIALTYDPGASRNLHLLAFDTEPLKLLQSYQTAEIAKLAGTTNIAVTLQLADISVDFAKS